MKKTILLILMFVSMSLTLNFPRHVDPSQVKEEIPSSIQLLNIYFSIGESLLNLDFKSASNNLKILRDAYIPRDILYIFSRFNNLLNETLNYMNVTKYHVDLASKYITISDFVEAEKHIHKGYENIVLAKLRLNELQDASMEFSSRMRIPYANIQEVLSKIWIGISELEKCIEDLRSRIEGLKPKLMRTFLEINVHPLRINYGEEITINGLLRCENGTLPFREVVISVGGEKYIVETDRYGDYFLKCNVTEYVSKIQVYVEYIPKGDDYGVYGYAKSDIVYLDVEFIKPKINIVVSPIKVKPLDKFNITINTIPNLKLNILFFNNLVSGYSDENGLFKLLNLIVPSNVYEGYYNISAENIPRDIIGPSKNNTIIMVYKLNPEVRIDFPSIMLSGFPMQIKVSTNKFSKISIKSNDIGVTFVDEGLNVSSIIMIPITFLGEHVEFNVEVYAKEPYIKNYQTTIQIKIINTPATIILLTIPIIIILNHFKTRRVKPSKIEEEVVTPKIVVMKEELPPMKKLFYDLIDLIRVLFGVVIKANDTIREYLSKLKPIIPQKLFNVLNRVLMGYEEAIYGEPKGEESKGKVIEGFRELMDRLMGGGE
ncbi:MAG: hypothetical protein QW481_05430 [Candidatus Methanomethylicia archaeon]